MALKKIPGKERKEPWEVGVHEGCSHCKKSIHKHDNGARKQLSVFKETKRNRKKKEKKRKEKNLLDKEPKFFLAFVTF